jgi:hypothetical protein
MEIFKKLNLKDQTTIYVVQAPPAFKAEIALVASTVKVETSVGSDKNIQFFLAFVTKQSEVDEYARQLVDCVESDAVIWLAYPKQSSKKYTCEFNRDTGWQKMGENGFEPVRQVAIDEDWSALRFRNPDHIKKMTRSFAMTEKGKRKVAATKKASR